MRKALIATLIGLSTLVLSQPAKADSKLSYNLAFVSIVTFEHDSSKNYEFRSYILKWLEQDKDYPHKVAMSFCKYRKSGWSNSQLFDMNYGELLQRKALENWSESRFKAYVKINTVGTLVGMKYYCTEFLDEDI